MYVDNGAFSYNPHKGQIQHKFMITIKAGAYMSTTIADSSAISTSSISTTYSTPFSGCISARTYLISLPEGIVVVNGSILHAYKKYAKTNVWDYA